MIVETRLRISNRHDFFGKGLEEMQRAETLSRLQVLFREFFDDAAIDLKEQSSGEDILDWDSLAHVRLILSVEKEFNCHFESEQIADLTNVGDLISAILSKPS